MHPLAERVLKFARGKQLLKPGDRVGVAVSGGADSVALLRLLLELRETLGLVLSGVHFNHKLRGTQSDEDEDFVKELAREHGLEFAVQSANVAERAGEHGGLEAAARHFRYEFFEELIRSGRLHKVTTGHTLDDQAETVLLRVIRGTGLQGLSGIRPSLPVHDAAEEVCGNIVRPLLQLRRSELETYLQGLPQAWREDSSNRDLAFTRNRVRHTLLPLLEREFNPGVASGLADLAEIASGEDEYWNAEISDCNAVVRRKSKDLFLDLRKMQAQPLAFQRRLVMSVAHAAALPLTFAHVESILALAADSTQRSSEASLPFGWRAVRQEKEIQILCPALRQQERIPTAYRYVLPVPGRTAVPEAGPTSASPSIFETISVTAGHLPAGYNPEHLYARHALAKELLVRNWKPGDRFWPAHSKSPRKVKELLQGKKIPQPERARWPVVVSGDEIVWLRGFPAPMHLRPAPDDREAILIRETENNGEGS